MNKILSTLLITAFLFTQSLFSQNLNPVVYAALGDNIYNNASKINNLQYLKEFQIYKDQIITYSKDVEAAKTMGFAIEEGNDSINKGVYLKKLRALSKTNDFFINTVNSNFKFSIKNEDNELFVNSVDSGLIDISRHGNKIKSYYKSHENDINEYGTVLNKLVPTYGPKTHKEKTLRGPTKKEIQDAKMRRIRQKDKAKQESIQKALEDELIRKKVNIRNVQKKELESTSK